MKQQLADAEFAITANRPLLHLPDATVRATRRRIDDSAAGVPGLALTLLTLYWLYTGPRADAADILGPNIAIPFSFSLRVEESQPRAD